MIPFAGYSCLKLVGQCDYCFTSHTALFGGNHHSYCGKRFGNHILGCTPNNLGGRRPAPTVLQYTEPGRPLGSQPEPLVAQTGGSKAGPSEADTQGGSTQA